MFIYDLLSVYRWGKQKKRARNKGNMYNFTVCWNDIKYIYVSHIVYNITNWYRFYLKFMYVKAPAQAEEEDEEKEVYTSLNSLYISYHGGIFSFWIFHLACKPLRLRIEARMLEKNRRRKGESEEEISKGKKLSFSLVCTRLVPYIKRAHECFSITFHVSSPSFLHTSHRMDARVIEKYIYVFMTRAPISPALSLMLKNRSPLLSLIRIHHVSTGMCACLLPHPWSRT